MTPAARFQLLSEGDRLLNGILWFRYDANLEDRVMFIKQSTDELRAILLALAEADPSLSTEHETDKCWRQIGDESRDEIEKLCTRFAALYAVAEAAVAFVDRQETLASGDLAGDLFDGLVNALQAAGR